MISLQAVTKNIGGRAIIAPFNLTLQAGEVVTLFGPNGCGKSTLLNIVAGEMPPDSGALISAEPIAQKIGMVFQDYRRHLLPYLNVADNIMLPLRLQRLNASAQQAAWEKLLHLLPLTVPATQAITSLSGGQAQRVSLQRAMIIEPRLLLLDEPFSAIDYQATLDLMTTLSTIVHQLRLTTLMVSHHLDEAIFLADRIIFMSPRPGRAVSELLIPQPRPRPLTWMGKAEFADLKLQALTLFQQALTAA